MKKKLKKPFPLDRDDQLRKSLLDEARRLGNLAAGRWVSAAKLAIAARDREGGAVADEAHAGRLLDDLLGWGLLEAKGDAPLGERSADLRHRLLRLSDLGWKLWSGQIDPMPGVWDRSLD